MKKKVSIIIVNWNGLKYIHECITSLINQTYNNIEIILVDNASSDDSVNFVKLNFPDVKIIQNKENLGFAEGVNIGIKSSSGDFIALFNQDAVAKETWLEILVQSLDNSDEIAAVAGKVFYYGDKYEKDAIFCTWSKIDPYTACPYNFNENEPSNLVDYLTGCALLINKDILDEIGLLDTRYFLYFDETDWCARAIRAGYKLMYIPEAIVWHVVSASIKNYDLKLFYMERNRIRFAIKNFEYQYVPLVFIIYFGEIFFEFFRGIKEKNILIFNVKMKSIYWNIINLNKTFSARKRDFSKIKKIQSYNKSLPLKKYPIGAIEKFFSLKL